jgi:hypothetical protein
MAKKKPNGICCRALEVCANQTRPMQKKVLKNLSIDQGPLIIENL